MLSSDDTSEINSDPLGTNCSPIYAIKMSVNHAFKILKEHHP